MVTDANKQQLSAVYVSWGTMKSSLDQLTQGIHSKIDRSVFAGMAWSVQNQLFAGMRFLGLINADNEPTPVLEGLVSGSEDERKEKLKAILQERYSEVFSLDLTKTTPQQLSQKMSDAYNVAGDTRDRAVRFFLSAAEYAGVSLSPLFKRSRTGVSAGTRKKRTTSKSKGDGSNGVEHSPQPRGQVTGAGKSKTISLKSGGTLTLTASVDVITLSTSDRQLVFELIDKFNAYPNPVSSKDGNAPTG